MVKPFFINKKYGAKGEKKMEQSSNPRKNKACTPQFRVRSTLIAGESVDACLNNVDYWQKVYVDKCAKQGVDVTPYLQSYTQ